MKYLKFLPVILVLIFLLYYYFGIYNGGKRQSQNNKQIESVSSAEQKQWETKIDDQLSINIKITPIELGGNVEIWRFGVVFDTHSGSLDDDLIQATALTDDKGRSYRPIAWEGSGPGGHHREGILKFAAINPLPAYLELKFKNIGGIPERLFKWNIK